MSKTKRVRNCNALIELMRLAKTERGRKFYKNQLYCHAMRIVETKNDPLG